RIPSPAGLNALRCSLIFAAPSVVVAVPITLAPCRASASAIALPIPRVAPVTSATLVSDMLIRRPPRTAHGTRLDTASAARQSRAVARPPDSLRTLSRSCVGRRHRSRTRSSSLGFAPLAQASSAPCSASPRSARSFLYFERCFDRCAVAHGHHSQIGGDAPAQSGQDLPGAAFHDVADAARDE